MKSLLPLIFALSLSAPFAAARDATVGASTVVLPEPPGYVDAARVAGPLQQYGQSLAPQSNRVLAFFVQKEEQQRVASGLAPQLKRYYMVQVNRSQENGSMTIEQFQQFRGMIRNQASTGPEGARTAPAGQEQMKALGVFDDRPTAISFVTNLSFPRIVNGKTETQPVVVASSVVLVKGKPLFLNTYFIRTSDADVAAARDSARAWLAAVERANPLLKK